MLKQIVFPSPDKKHKVILTPIDESQSGDYYSLSIDILTDSFVGRTFGKVCLWSPESRYLIVQEWKETGEASTPKFCQLLIVDVLARRECVIANVEETKAVILPESFIGESLMYTVIYSGQFGVTKSFESKFHYLSGWQTIK